MKALDAFLGWFNTIRTVVAIFIAALLNDSAVAVGGTRRPVGGFFAELIAIVFNIGLPIAVFVAAIYAGQSAYIRSDDLVIAWSAGLAVFSLPGVIAYWLVSQISGVDWRFERLQGSDY